MLLFGASNAGIDAPKIMIEQFQELYGSALKPRVFRAPGRVNLIGEHTDYNLGFVTADRAGHGLLPMASAADDRFDKIRACTRWIAGTGFDFDANCFSS